MLAPAWLDHVALVAGIEPPARQNGFAWCDLGCGQGVTAAILAATHPCGLFHGVDAMPVHVDHARRLAIAAAITNLELHAVDFAAALGLAQHARLDEILERRRLIEHLYCKHVQSFEGIKDPYVAPDVTEVNWFLYIVHLGTRFSKSSRDAIVEDLRTEDVEAAAYCNPLHLQRHYFSPISSAGCCSGWLRSC